MIAKKYQSEISVIKFNNLSDFISDLESLGLKQEEDFMVRGSGDELRVRFYPQYLDVYVGDSIEAVKVTNCYLIDVL